MLLQLQGPPLYSHLRKISQLRISKIGSSTIFVIRDIAEILKGVFEFPWSIKYGGNAADINISTSPNNANIKIFYGKYFHTFFKVIKPLQVDV